MGDFQLFNAECAETLSATCDRIVVSEPFSMTFFHLTSTISHNIVSIYLLSSQIDLEIIAKNYEAMCPKDILTAATVYVKCYMKLKTLMEHVDDSILIDTSELYISISLIFSNVDWLEKNIVKYIYIARFYRT